MLSYRKTIAQKGRRIIPLSETEQKVADYLKEQGIDFATVALGYGKEKSGDTVWEHDRWMVRFFKRDMMMEQEYKTGLGHRAGPPMPSDVRNSHPRSAWRENWVHANVKPYAPCAASVLHSLLSDARCGADHTFDEFCAELGYDTDSRRAMDTYLACQAVHAQLVKVFTREQREHLEQMLEDY